MIDEPEAGSAVKRPNPLRGSLVNALDPAQVLWSATGVGGRIFPADNACAVDSSRQFQCDDLYVGADGEHGKAHDICVFIADDDGVFRDYAGRINKKVNNPGIASDNLREMQRECVTVTN